MSNTQELALRISPAIEEAIPGLGVQVVWVQGVRRARLEADLRATAERDRQLVATRRETLERRIEDASRLFATRGCRFPLAGQLAKVIDGGLPHTPPIVSALLRCETLTGALIGAHNVEAITGGLRLDVTADRTEQFEGMRGLIKCDTGEIVLRDEDGIIASLFQGPDHRTRIVRRTTDVVFLIFDLQRNGNSVLEQASQYLVGLFEQWAQIRVVDAEPGD